MPINKFNPNTFKIVQEAFQKQYGKSGGILISGDQGVPSLECTPIGDPILDLLLSGEAGSGGILDGAFIEIAGGNACGKTTLSMEILASYFNKHPDRGVAFIDMEGAFDSRYASHIGVPINDPRFIFHRPVNGKEACTLMENLIKTGMFSCIVLDSWAALSPPISEKKSREAGDTKMSAHALMTSEVLREIKPLLKPNNTTIIALNQFRTNITPMGAFGKKSTGGEALPFYSDVRLKVERVSQKADERKVTVVKSKMQAIAGDSCIIQIQQGMGLDRLYSCIQVGVTKNLISISSNGTHAFNIPGIEPFSIRGKDNISPYFEENPEHYRLLLEALDVPWSPLRTKVFKRALDDLETVDGEDETLDIDIDD